MYSYGLGDAHKLRHVFANVIGNAIKFTERGGSTDVTVSQDFDAGGCLITVTDTGIGMTNEEAKRCIEPFARIESAYTRNQIGAGLGLPMVAKIMALHDGNFNLHSSVGQGTTVIARFPPKRTPGARIDYRRPQAGGSAKGSA